MKSAILLLAFAAATLSSCTTAYKSGQTPDDVYYSPARPQDEYVQTQKDDDRRYRGNDEYYDDRYLRMKVRDRSRWSDLDDWYYFGNRYNYYAYNNLNNPWSPNTYWNYYYNPYCKSCCVTVNTKSNVVYSGPRTFNLNTYNSNSLTTKNYTNTRNNNSSGYNYNYSGSTTPRTNSNSGNILRDLFGGGNKNGSSGSNSNSSSTGSSSSGSSSGSSGTTAPVRKF